MLGTFEYMISFNHHSNLLRIGATIALNSEQTGSEIQDLAQGHKASKCDFFLNLAFSHYISHCSVL